MRRAIILGAIFVGCFLGFKAAAGEESYTPEATRCGHDIANIYNFWQGHIANTPDPQLTLETGIYINRAGVPETYADLLHREAGYEARWC